MSQYTFLLLITLLNLNIRVVKTRESSYIPDITPLTFQGFHEDIYKEDYTNPINMPEAC